MPKTLVVACLLLATSAALSQSSQSCFSYFAQQDQQILASPQIADPVVLRNMLKDILLSSYSPDAKENMIACANQRHEDASKGLNPTPTAQPAPTVPQTFAPSVSQVPMPTVPATAPTVRPMDNYAPNQMIQNGQAMMQSGLQMMMMADLMATQTQNAAAPKKTSAVRYSTKQAAEKVFDETVRIISSEKYALRVADKSRGTIQAVGMAWGSETVSAAVFISIQSTESGALLQAIFAKYPGIIGGRSPKKLAASFEKDLRNVQPDLIAEQ